MVLRRNFSLALIGITLLDSGSGFANPSAANSIFTKARMRNPVGASQTAGEWFVPVPPPATTTDSLGHKVTLKVGAIQATLLPNGKVLMVSGTSNRFTAVDHQKFGEGPAGKESQVNDMKAANPNFNGFLVDPSIYEHADATVLFDPEATRNGGHGYTKVLSTPDVEAHKADADPAWANIDLFCGGNHPLPDGNALFVGGTARYMDAAKVNGLLSIDQTEPLGHFWGVKRAQIFNWKTSKWERLANMSSGRWYPTLTELPDGKIMIFGGMNENGVNNTKVDIYDPKSKNFMNTVEMRNLPVNPVNQLGGNFDNYMRIFLMHDGSNGISKLLLTADGSAEGIRARDQRHTLLANVSTANNNFRLNFTPGPNRIGDSRLYSTEIFDPTSDQGDVMIFGGGVENFSPIDTDIDTLNNTKPDRKTSDELEVFHAEAGKTGHFDAPIAQALGTSGDTTPGRSAGRLNLNAVILPTQQVLVLGGGNHAYIDPLFHPVLYTPEADAAKQGATAAPIVGKYRRQMMNPFNFPRLYHNTTLLLPDGRVLMASGNSFLATFKGIKPTGELDIDQSNKFTKGLSITGAVANADVVRKRLNLPLVKQADGKQVPMDIKDDQPAETYQVEIFSPPYLFKGNRPTLKIAKVNDRPAIDQSPNGNLGDVRIGYGQPISLQIQDQAQNLAKGRVTLVKLGAVTHGMDVNQKLIVLGKDLDGGTISVKAPSSNKVATPGYYMLFYVNGQGVPSVAKMVQLI